MNEDQFSQLPSPQLPPEFDKLPPKNDPNQLPSVSSQVQADYGLPPLQPMAQQNAFYPDGNVQPQISANPQSSYESHSSTMPAQVVQPATPSFVNPSSPVLPTPLGQPTHALPSASIHKKKPIAHLVILIVLAFFFAAGLAYVEFIYRSPSNTFKRSMGRLNTLALSINATTDKFQKSAYKQAGSIDLSGTNNFNANYDGFYDNNVFINKLSGTYKSHADSVEVRSYNDSLGQQIYLKITGLSDIFSAYMKEKELANTDPTATTLSSLAKKYDSKWVLFDISKLAKDYGLDTSTQLSQQDIFDIEKVATGVAAKDMFRTDTGHQILVMKKYYGAQKFEGSNTYKLKVGLDKTGLLAFAEDMKNALKNTKLHDLVPSDKTFEQYIDYDGLKKDIGELDYNKLTADVWVDSWRSYVRNVRFSPSGDIDSNNTYTLDIGVDYKGGDEVPVTAKLTATDKGVATTGTAKFTFNTKSGSLNLNASASEASAVKNNIILKLNSTPTSETTDATRPTDAIDYQTLMEEVLSVIFGAK